MSVAWSPPSWVDDQLMPLHSDENQGENGHRDGDALYERIQFAHGLPEDPVVHQRVYKSEGETHDGHKQV